MYNDLTKTQFLFLLSMHMCVLINSTIWLLLLSKKEYLQSILQIDDKVIIKKQNKMKY